MFEIVLRENFVELFETSSNLIKCRVALMLGYYADNLFQHNNELFVKTIEFLFKGLSMEKEEKALSLQCADTVKTVINDEDLISRVEGFITNLFPFLCQMVSTQDLPTFFDILMTIISSYGTVIDANVIGLLNSLVARVEKEYKALREKGEKNNMTINQCWNVIRSICEQETFFPEHIDSIENSLLPMFNYLVDPTNIEFDDDMLQIITTLIKKRNGVSENMAKIFPCLQKFFTKYNGAFGSLLPTLNSYIYFGKEIMAANKEWQQMILQLGVMSMFNNKPQIELNNTEGAILCQMLLQNVGNHALDSYIPQLLQQVIKRLQSEPHADYLTRQLYNVILCAICNNWEITFHTLETEGKTEAIFDGLLKNAETCKVSYDRKVMVIGLANLFTQTSLPPSIIKMLPKILEVIIVTLQKQTTEETKKLMKTDKKVISLGESESDSSESDEDEGKMEMENEKEKAVGK